MAAAVLGNVRTPEGLKKLDEHMAKFSFVSGFIASKEDAEVFGKVGSLPDKKQYPNAARWYRHIATYESEERAAFPKGGAVSEAVKQAAAAPAKAAVAAPVKPKAADKPAAGAGKEEDEDFDLFGDETVEDKAAKEALKNAEKESQKKKEKKKVIDKSTVVFHVSPYDAETDLDLIEKAIREVEMDGLLWGINTFQRVPVAYGLSKLAANCVIEDDKVGLDDIIDLLEGKEELIQSCTVASFQKL